MTASITPSTDGKYVEVFVRIAFKKFGGRKIIAAPNGTAVPARAQQGNRQHADQGAVPRLALAEAA